MNNNRAIIAAILVLFVSVFSFNAYAQNDGVGINILTPDQSAILHVESNDRGFLPPRMTTTERDAIANPAEGLIIYNLDEHTVQYYNGTCWVNSNQRDCNDCDFIIQAAVSSAFINKTSVQSVDIPITVAQTSGITAQQIGVVFLTSLPDGITATFDSSIVDSAGTIVLTVAADVFAGSGVFPIVLQAVCGGTIRFTTVQVEVAACQTVTINSDQTNYDLAVNSGLNLSSSPQCVIVTIEDQVTVLSNNVNTPAFTTGAVHPQTHVGFRMLGNILGRGGDGGNAGDLLTFSFGEDGDDGGIGLELTCEASFDVGGSNSCCNQGGFGFIGGGGGGGGGTGVGLATPSLPFIGAIGGEFGVGGGGGVANGLGGVGFGNNAGPLFFSQFTPGGNAGSAVNSYGEGGSEGITLDLLNTLGLGGIISAVPGLSAQLDAFASIDGGDGGDFGQDGGDASGSAGIIVDLSVFGITLFNQTFSFSVPTSDGGDGAQAIKTNGNPINNLVIPNPSVLGDVGP